MKRPVWFIHPIFIFILSTVALAISLFLYIYWYIGISTGLQAVALRYHLDPNQFFEAKTWVVILVLSLLVGIILGGILLISIFYLKTLKLYRLQNSFINNFTHELKTPVTSLKLYLETFARHEIPREDQLKYIGFMLQDTERLSSNINSILNLARIERGVYEGVFTQVDLIEMMKGFLAGNRHLFTNGQIHLENPAGKSYRVSVIVPLFEMLLMNILSNAIKYNKSEIPRVDMIVETDKNVLRLHFRDNGIGIAKGERKKIFRKFYQSEQSDECIPAGGSGIGLYLAQQIAKLHGGKIAVHSDGREKGSIFTLTLPLTSPQE
ncbi:MAG: HAMP domain-containing histidine kinase [Syntrophaceae bacterium]|nr:HAMP domain-containing histidine kinase [Syntrophaceae bacterium]